MDFSQSLHLSTKKPMRIVLLIVLFVLPLSVISQEGFNYIYKAEKQIKKDNFRKALALLEKADSAHYGFCGNAWLDAKEAIARARLLIYHKQQDYYTCVKVINDVKIAWNFHKNDSLKMEYLIKLADKETIKQELDLFMDSFKYDCSLNVHTVDITFSVFEEPLSFSCMELTKRIRFLQNDQPYSDEEAFRIAFREQQFYTLLTDETDF